jgi:biopolymer transport protein TolR
MPRKLGLGKKKELNADLNLTPFIDLLSTMVCFLLITAVWIEIGSLEIKQSKGTQAQESKKESYDLDMVFTGHNKISLNLKKGSRRVKKITVNEKDFQATITKLNTVIGTQIKNFKNKTIEIATATVTPNSTVDYGNMVKALDVLRKNEIINIGVLSSKGR